MAPIIDLLYFEVTSRLLCLAPHRPLPRQSWNYLAYLYQLLANPPGIYSVSFSVNLKGVRVPGPTTFPRYYSVWYIPSSRQLGGRPDTQGMKSEGARLAPGLYHHLTQCS